MSITPAHPCIRPCRRKSNEKSLRRGRSCGSRQPGPRALQDWVSRASVSRPPAVKRLPPPGGGVWQGTARRSLGRSPCLHFAPRWCEHGEVLVRGLPYREVAPQLVLMAFLQHVVNAGRYVEREYGVGRGRIDLLVRWALYGRRRRAARSARGARAQGLEERREGSSSQGPGPARRLWRAGPLRSALRCRCSRDPHAL